MIDRDTIDRIYAAANIVEIVGDYVTLKKKGANYQACCPFHNEKTPSFVVSPVKGLYKCFGCGKGGNAITFVMEHESITYPEALKVVAKRYGIEVKERELSGEELQRNDNRESQFVLNSWAYDYFIKTLFESDEGVAVGLSYFRLKRKFSDATIRKFGLGYCLSQSDAMSRAALAANYKEEFLLSTGLSLKREADGRIFDRFRDRVIFPVHNISGRIVAFGGRTLRTDKKVAKYQNSPESEIYSKKRELYGLFFAKKAIQQEDYVIMVEGYTDVISMHQSGIENVVSSSGTSLTTEQIRLLNRFTKNVTVIYDGDAAGVHAAIRGIDMILREGMNVRVVSLPPEHDPDSFAQAHTAAEVSAYIRDNEEDFLTYKAKLLLKESRNDPIKRAEMIGDMVESITQIPDQIKRTVFIKECSMIMDIDESVLFSEVARKRATATGDRQTEEFIRTQNRLQQSERRAATEQIPTSGDAGSNIVALECELMKYLLKAGHRSIEFKEGNQMISCNIASLIFSELDDTSISFSDPSYNAMLNIYRQRWSELGEGVEVPTSTLLESDNPDVCNRTVDILTCDDNYIPSQIWSQRDIHVDSEEEMLTAGVPKALMLYKSKILESTINDLNEELKNESLTEDQQLDIAMRLSKLHKGKVLIAKKVQRTIL
ncbi:MAG: DNA primase [Rikenellaceae bacterium]